MNPFQAYKICETRNCRVPELEKFIIKDASCCVNYIRHIIKESWEQGEEVISKDARSSFTYAQDVIKGRWEKGEKKISTIAFYSFHYSTNVIKEPFYLGHPVIFNSYFKNDYITFLKLIKCDLNKISEWLI